MFLSQSEYTSCLEFGITEAGYKPCVRLKFFKLGRVVETKFYYKIISKIYVLQVLLTILIYIGLLIINYLDEVGYMSIKL